MILPFLLYRLLCHHVSRAEEHRSRGALRKHRPALEGRAARRARVGGEYPISALENLEERCFAHLYALRIEPIVYNRGAGGGIRPSCVLAFRPQVRRSERKAQMGDQTKRARAVRRTTACRWRITRTERKEGPRARGLHTTDVGSSVVVDERLVRSAAPSRSRHHGPRPQPGRAE